MPVAALTPAALLPAIDALFTASAAKIDATEAAWRPEDGSPVFTVEGRWRARGWTEWTQGFQFGSALLQFDATGDRHFLELGRSRTVERMAPHLTHVGVHDHGFNNVSTYGALWRLAGEGRYEASDWERRFYALALQVSGAVQARRWTRIPSGGYIYSFNGAHSLFVDTVRSLRALAIAHQLGHRLAEEQDAQISLLDRLVQHARATAEFSVYYGRGRDTYDRRGRTAHESLFNVANGTYRGPSSQQGYSPFSTWTRGLAWAMLGFAEQLEFIATVADGELAPLGGREAVEGVMREAAQATSDFYIDEAADDGIPYWDTGAPGLAALDDWRPRRRSVQRSRARGQFGGGHRRAGPAAARTAPDVAWRGRRSLHAGRPAGRRDAHRSAGPYLSTDAAHHGLLLHSVYHWPNGWDHVPAGARVPRGESSQWGDYHLREVALYVRRLARAPPT